MQRLAQIMLAWEDNNTGNCRTSDDDDDDDDDDESVDQQPVAGVRII